MYKGTRKNPCFVSYDQSEAFGWASFYRAEPTDVPAAANTMAISVCANDKKHCTTTGSNCVPLDSTSRRMASSGGRPLRYGREETIASNASMTETMRETTGISVSFNPAG